MIVEYVSNPRFTLGLKKRRIDGKPYSPKIQRFDDDGKLRVDDSTEEGKEIIDFMENDIRFNQEYRRVSVDEQNLVADHFSQPIAHKPAGEIEDSWYEKIKYLEEKCDKDKFVVTEASKVCKTIDELMVKFDVHGIQKPTNESSVRLIKSVIMQMLDVFEQCEIYPNNELIS
jgi:hypothetical protein